MDEAVIRSAVDELAEREFTDADEHGYVSATVNGAGVLVGLEINEQTYRGVPVDTFCASVVEAVARARTAAGVAGRDALHGLGFDVEAFSEWQR